MRFYIIFLGIFILGFILVPAESALSRDRTNDFSTDPQWDAKNNRIDPGNAPTVTQDFGYSMTNHCGGEKPGETGGTVQRSLTHASYAKVIPVRTLNDPLKASGKFCVTHAEGGSNVLFGWFNKDSRGWRTPNSLVMRLDGNGGKYWVFFEYGTQGYQTGGGSCFEGEAYQKTKTPPERADGTVHTWSLGYDPNAAGGQGEITFFLDDRKYVYSLPPGHKEDGAVFDRFGIMNAQTTGDKLTAWFDDLVLEGVKEDFSKDPGWEENGNRAKFVDRAVRPYHDFGFSQTKYAGGQPGETGGIIWRADEKKPEQSGYYADRVGPLGMDQPLHAGGRVAMTKAGADSAVLIGWFNSETHIGTPPKNFAGIVVEGPSRIGHYFRPAYSNSNGDSAIQPEGPVIRPNSESHTWTLDYDPNGGGGNGKITVTLDSKSVSIELKPGVKKAGAVFDRFGMLSWQSGGHHVEIYLDDINYTAENERQ